MNQQTQYLDKQVQKFENRQDTGKDYRDMGQKLSKSRS
jgi:hypothetical protein